MNYFKTIDAKQEIIKLLGENVNNDRVKKELSKLSSTNFKQILLAKYISDILKENNYYFYVSSDANNLYINYLLGITNVNPLEYSLPFELNTLHYGFICPNNDSKELVINKLMELTGNNISNYKYNNEGKIVEVKWKYIIPLKENIKIPNELNSINKDYLVFNLNVSDKLDKLNYFINKYGLPNKDIYNDDKINYEIFAVNRIAGIDYSKNSLIMERLLKKISEDKWIFNTYLYISSALWMNRESVNVILNKTIDEGLMQKYPASKDSLFSLLLDNGVSKKTALKIVNNSLETNNKLKKYIPEYLIEYLKNTYLVGLGHVISLAKIDYLNMYYKITAPDYYEVMLGDYINEFNNINMDDIQKYCLEYESDNYDKRIEESSKYYYSKLYLEYKNVSKIV